MKDICLIKRFTSSSSLGSLLTMKATGIFARPYLFLEIVRNLDQFDEKNFIFFANFRTFVNISKCKALGDFLISFLEIII